jgi:hypothetical protein
MNSLGRNFAQEVYKLNKDWKYEWRIHLIEYQTDIFFWQILDGSVGYTESVPNLFTTL